MTTDTGWKKFSGDALRTMGVVIIGMLGFWMVEGREYVTRSDVVELMDREAPYVQDREWIRRSLERHEESNNELNTTLKTLNDTMIELKTEIKFLRSQ